MPEQKNDQQDEQQPNEAGVEEDANAETDQDQNPDGEQQEDSEAEGDEDAEAGDEDSDDEGSDDQSDEDGEELDLDRAKAKIAKANDEAKNLRSRLRETEEKLKNAKSPEEVDEIVQQMTKDREAAEHALLRENVALKFKLPEKAHKRLAGSTREELEADAKELAELFGTDEDDEDVTLEGGLSPRDRGSEDSDPRSLAQRYGARRARR